MVIYEEPDRPSNIGRAAGFPALLFCSNIN